MMDFKSIETFEIPTYLATSAKVLYGKLPNTFSPLFDCTFYRFGTLGIGSFLYHTF